MHGEEGRILAPGAASNTDYVNEYHYKDGQGNLRVSFREAAPYAHKATMEPFVAGQEEATWSNVGAPFRENTTNACTPSHAAKLTAQHRIGPWKTLKVGKGDKITVRAKGLYVATAPVNSSVNWGVYVQNMSTPTGTESGNTKSLLTVGLSVNFKLCLVPERQVPLSSLPSTIRCL